MLPDTNTPDPAPRILFHVEDGATSEAVVRCARALHKRDPRTLFIEPMPDIISPFRLASDDPPNLWEAIALSGPTSHEEVRVVRALTELSPNRIVCVGATDNALDRVHDWRDIEDRWTRYLVEWVRQHMLEPPPHGSLFMSVWRYGACGTWRQLA